ncbi:hypothetical protein A7982_12963 [Minicystis rosea]|nr:hypothetical protein A7982_12963 [Minicystis rosea]
MHPCPLDRRDALHSTSARSVAVVAAQSASARGRAIGAQAD